ncbi:pilus assembly protein [Altererythrobacter arenosus]|uniref:Pilus assembly protein n=1 Tax=Altererythrobacter arenosus TaxID=3032592 RepID=A0ABY8FN74_9SPHN|nr:TadE/TadG family type IV pilus assembly protein [Altererythrobacter sp. CAU 1644]WFL76463.1 pilus assembly protein [Altererythrobacter sp. CAU 1644]
MSQFLRNLARDTAGNALMMFAAALVPILLMIGSGLDASITYMARNKMQNACDAGALAGRLAMIGTSWTTDTEAEARKFFNFNFPAGTNGVDNVQFSIDQDPNDPTMLIGSATGTVPTTIMYMVGYDSIDISVACDATRDLGHNDVMLVLDVTSSMLNEPSTGGGVPKIDLLREGVMGLYRALDTGTGGSITRYGFVPFSQTVNVARNLSNQDIVRPQYFVDLNMQTCTKSKGVTTCTTTPVGRRLVGPKDSYYNNGQNGAANENAIIQGFRTSGNGCIEERPTVGTSYNDGQFTITTMMTLDDINETPGNAVDVDKQFGRYEPVTMEGEWWDACVSEAKSFATYDSESAFETAVDEATARVVGGTYSDIGMLWGLRFSSRDGFLAATNPKEVDDIPINVHIIYFTDGYTYGTNMHYSSFGLERYQNRLLGSGVYADNAGASVETTANHRERFRNLCTLAKSMGITVWVVTLDVPTNADHLNCATSSSHFFESDGTDLEDKFTSIGQGIGNLRLTK